MKNKPIYIGTTIVTEINEEGKTHERTNTSDQHKT